MSGTPTNRDTATSGEVSMLATTVSRIVTTATMSRGTPNRTACWMRLTSFVVRATRSPVPARSTVERGRVVTVSRKSSRSSAKTVSPKIIEYFWAYRIRTAWTSTAPTPIAMTWLT